MTESKITIIAGHYGSGKTNFAVNYALYLKTKYDKVTIADLDIVNPYFRTKDSAELLSKAGIRLISSAYANTNVDVPAVPGEMNAIFDGDSYSVIDVGGDDRGAFALGRYTGKLANSDVSAFLVVNMYRPLSRDFEATAEIMREIETAGRIKFTGIINNSNLGGITTGGDVISSLAYADKIAEVTGIPVIMTSVKRDLYIELQEKKIKNLFPIDLEGYQWLQFQK